MKKLLGLIIALACLYPALAWADAGGSGLGVIDNGTAPICTCTCSYFGSTLPLDTPTVNLTATECTSACNRTVADFNQGFEDPAHANDIFTCPEPTALEPELVRRDPIFPTLNVLIPGFNPNDSIKIDPNTGIQHSNLLGSYVTALYAYLLLAATVVAITMLMIAGLQYATARGDAGQVTKAKTRIQNAIVGVILLLLAYNIAFIVDPATVKFDPLTLQSIEGEEAFPPEGEDTDVNPVASLTGGTTQIVGNHLIAQHGVTVAADVLPQLQVAVDVFAEKTKRNVFISSATRDIRQQATLYYNNCIVNGGNCSVPTCNPASTTYVSLTGLSPGDAVNQIILSSKPGNCPHTSGIALDAWCSDGGSDYKHDPACQQELIKAMTDNGFCRLKSEVWHFELASKKVSNACSASNNTITYTSKEKGSQTPNSDCKMWDFKEHECTLVRPLE